jgi:hypothetical protein
MVQRRLPRRERDQVTDDRLGTGFPSMTFLLISCVLLCIGYLHTWCDGVSLVRHGRDIEERMFPCDSIGWQLKWLLGVCDTGLWAYIPFAY